MKGTSKRSTSACFYSSGSIRHDWCPTPWGLTQSRDQALVRTKTPCLNSTAYPGQQGFAAHRPYPRPECTVCVVLCLQAIQEHRALDRTIADLDVPLRAAGAAAEIK